MQKRQSLWSNSRIHTFLLIATLAVIVVPFLNKTPSLEVSKQSTEAATQFLSLVDREAYSESWQSASDVLQQLLALDEWNRKVAAMRKAHGAVVERVPQEVVYADPGGDAPAGEYVIVTFDTIFRFRAAATETVTLHLNQDGEWQVAGYFLR